jgi:hypothetical protein
MKSEILFLDYKYFFSIEKQKQQNNIVHSASAGVWETPFIVEKKLITILSFILYHREVEDNFQTKIILL